MPTLSIHGDVHIPDNLIHALGLKPSTKLAFERQGDAIIMRPVKTTKEKIAGLWRYRIGDYRLICQIKDTELIILLLEIGHRKDVYK